MENIIDPEWKKHKEGEIYEPKEPKPVSEPKKHKEGEIYEIPRETASENKNAEGLRHKETIDNDNESNTGGF